MVLKSDLSITAPFSWMSFFVAWLAQQLLDREPLRGRDPALEGGNLKSLALWRRPPLPQAVRKALSYTTPRHPTQ